MSEATFKAALSAASDRLGRVSDSPALDAEVLLAEVLECPRSRFFSAPEQTLDAEQLAQFQRRVEQREAGTPIAYLLGRKEFWSLELGVSAAVLIPRPETELLVELSLERGADPIRVLELGTGSGAIALALASERPLWQITAVERSALALEQARANGAQLGLAVDWRLGSWYAAVAGEHFDLILSNPPYLAADDRHLADLRAEPHCALVAGATGLEQLACIIKGAAAHLRPNGGLWLEHGQDQGSATRELMRNAGFRDPRTHTDLAGLDRATGFDGP